MKRIVLIALAALALATPVTAQQTAVESPAPERPKATHVFTEAPDDHTIGAEDAPLLMHIYASVTCPHCGAWFSDDYPRVKSELIDTGKLRLVFRALPTPPVEMSMVGFLLAECAPEAEYMDVLVYQMQNQKQILDAARAGKAKAEYEKIAALAGMENADAINACLSNPDIVDQVFTMQSRANAAGVRGVPAVFVNGQPFEGDLSAQTLISVLSEMDENGTSQLPETLPQPKAQDHSSHGH